MAGNIKGIIVEIGGDTSGLQKALKDVNSKTASLSKELRGINSLLKLDPKNTELLSQKQTVLKQKIEATTNQLNNLKEAQKRFIESGGNLNTNEYRNLQREIILTENNLKQMNLEASKWTQASQNLSALSSKMKSFGDAVTNIGKKASVASAAVASLFGIGIKYNADIETTTKAFETFLGSAEDANKAINQIKKQSQTSPFDTKELIKANQFLITTGESADNARNTISALADAIALTGGGNDELNRMASNLQQIKNAGKATSMDIRQFAYAGIDVYGILAETTGKNVEELKKMDITYEELSNALIQASNEGGKYYNGQTKMSETLNGKIGQLKKTFEDLLGELSQTLMPIISSLTEKLQGLVNWFKNLDQGQKDMITKIGLAIVAIGPLLIIIGKLISFGGVIIGVVAKLSGIIGGLSAGVGGLSTVLTVLTGPVGIVIAVIGALIAMFVHLYKTNEEFRNNVQIIWSKIAEFFNKYVKAEFEKMFKFIGDIASNFFATFKGVFGAIEGVLSGIIQFIAGVFSGDWKKAWEGVKNIFSNIVNGLVAVFKLPLNNMIALLNMFIRGLNNIKVPDWVPGVGGKGINIPLIPKLAKGGIVDSATLAMIGEGRSAEAVIPLDRTLTKYMAEAMRQVGSNNPINVNFYPQKMTEAEMDMAFDYINRRFGMAY